MGNELDEKVLDTARDLQLREDANKRAAATPFPAAMGELLKTGEIKIDDKTFVRRVVAADWKVFQALNSPIHQMALESQKDEKIREEVQFDEVNEWELYWQFTHDIVEVLFATGLADEDDKIEWLETHKELPFVGDAKSYRRMVKKEVGRKFSALRVRTVTSAIIQQFIASNSTKIGFEVEDSEESKKN